MAVAEEVRRRLARLCASPRTRDRTFSRARPTVWQSFEITDPRSGEVFTEAGAWEYIAEQITAGVLIETKVLDHPPGKKAYVLRLPSCNSKLLIYVKLELGADKVLGRSFHYNNRNGEDAPR